MDQSCVGSENRSLLMERYPEIFFLLSYTSFQSPQVDICKEEVTRFCEELNLAGVDVLYMIGVAQGHSYIPLNSWLKEKRERVLIYVEDDLGAIDALLQMEHSTELLSDPQVHLQFLQDPKALNQTLKTLVETYSAHRIEVAAFNKPPQLLKKIRLKLMRETAVTNALMTEALYSHRLVENILVNLKWWPQSFFANKLKGKFQGIPAVICGAGPSLGAAIPILQTLEDRALIIAGGSTITALSNRGIVPHLGLALDPNPEEYDRLRVMSAYEMPFLYGTRVQPDVFNVCNGPRGYLHSFTGGPCEAYFERQLKIQADPVGPGLGPEAFSVTTLAIALAVEMGCNPIILSGVDLAYTGMQRYAEGVMPSSRVFFQELQKETRASERLLKRKGIRGSMVYTLVKWVMESSSIAAYAKAHRSQAEFINVSPSGLGFKGIVNRSFEEVIDSHCQKSLDLRAMVHHEIEKSRFSAISQEAVAEQMRDVLLSLEKLLALSNQMLEELTRVKDSSPDLPFPTGRMTVLQLDFEEEKAFDCFFPHVGPAIDRLLNRSHPISTWVEPHLTRTRSIERLITKWERLNEMIEQERKILSNLTLL